MIKSIALISILSLLAGCYEDDAIYTPIMPEIVSVSFCDVPEHAKGWGYAYMWVKVDYKITNGVVEQLHTSECMKVGGEHE